jgi:hypothetical protein
MPNARLSDVVAEAKVGRREATSGGARRARVARGKCARDGCVRKGKPVSGDAETVPKREPVEERRGAR